MFVTTLYDNRYKQSIVNADISVANYYQYIGEAEPGTAKATAKWRIKRVTVDTTGQPTELEWANGDNSFAYKMTLYASYTYS